jgi:hypothetical protein
MTNGMKSDNYGLPVALIYTGIKGRNNFIVDVKASPQSDRLVGSSIYFLVVLEHSHRLTEIAF